MKNKVLVRLFVPLIEEEYDIFLPIQLTIGSIKKLLKKAVGELSDGRYISTYAYTLLNQITHEEYLDQMLLEQTDIRNGTKLILL